MIATGCALLATASCTAGDEPDNAAAPETPEATSSSPATPPTPGPVLSRRPGEVVELDRRGPEYVFTKEGRYAVRLSPEWLYEVDAPDMWEVYRGRYFSTSDVSGGTRSLPVDGPTTNAWLPAHDLLDLGRTRPAIHRGGLVRDPCTDADLEVLGGMAESVTFTRDR